MSSTSLYRLSGICLLIGSLLVTLGVIPIFFIGDDSTSTIAATGALLRVLGGMLIVVGLPGMYSRQAQRAGLLGLIGFLLTLFYILILGVAGDTINAFVVPFIASAAPSLLKGSLPSGLETFFFVGGLLGLVGGILLGIATLRTSVLPRWAGLPLIVGAVLSFIGNFLPPVVSTIGIVLFLIGLAWLGFGVWRYQQPGVQPGFVNTREIQLGFGCGQRINRKFGLHQREQPGHVRGLATRA
jgi:hypothetical protein